MNRGHLIAAYIFGSVARGQHDGLSDLNVLAVVQDGRGKVPESAIASIIPGDLRSLKLSISWYGARRLREMFRNGELFAWHLQRETRPLFDPDRFLSVLGAPGPYREWRADVASFRSILDYIPHQIAQNPFNAVYEAGLVYVCLRNIAMAGSWVLCEFPDFSRYSAFNLGRMPPCPISVGEFETAMHCRMAAQRGQTPPANVDDRFVLDLFRRLKPWLDELQRALLEASDGQQCAA